MRRPSNWLTKSIARDFGTYNAKSILTRAAFSLLELIAVMVVLGIISALGFLSVVGQLDQASLMRASQAIADADRKERIAARQSPTPGELLIENKMQRMRFKCSRKLVQLDGSVTIADIELQAPMASNPSIVYSQTGQSPSYAICLESRRGALKWVVVIGMSGQIIITDQTSEVRSILATGA